MKTSVFEYVVVFAPVDADGNETEKAKIVLEGRTLAKTMDKAAFAIARMIPEEYADQSDFVEIVIRSF